MQGQTQPVKKGDQGRAVPGRMDVLCMCSVLCTLCSALCAPCRGSVDLSSSTSSKKSRSGTSTRVARRGPKVGRRGVRWMQTQTQVQMGVVGAIPWNSCSSRPALPPVVTL